MPKQRNHPHHHNHADRARRLGGLQLPQRAWSLLGPRFVNPPGWVTRWPWNGPIGVYLVYILTAIIAVAVMFACAGGVMLWQGLFSPR
jgi:hypothetical protein